MVHNTAPLTIALSLAAGVIGLTIARHMRTPGIILLLLVGVGLGADGLAWVDPKELGFALEMIVGMAVAVILFEGGLHLELARLKTEGATINKLISLGALVTATGSSLAAYYIMGWGWQLAVLFGALVIVTGPTVVTPLLRRLRVKGKLQTILEAEGVLIDPVGAIFAVVAFDWVLTASVEAAAVSIGLFLGKMLFGMAVGAIGGYVIGLLLRHEKLVPDELENILTLSLVLLLFEFSNVILKESGIMTVTIAGVVVGNMRIPMHRRLVDFKEQLTTMLIGVLFVLLAADVRLSSVRDLGWNGFLTVAIVMVVVRPLNVLVSTLGSQLTWRERLFMCWLAPRGIVAAAVASLFVSDLDAAGIDGASSLKSLVFLVIAMTVIIQGLTAGPLAKLLGVRRNSNDGYVIVGANPIGRLVARLLGKDGDEVVLIDRNTADCQVAAREGFQVIYGNALENHVLGRAKIEVRRGVIGLTPNEGVNLMLLERVKEYSKEPSLYLTVNQGSDVAGTLVQGESPRNLLFATQVDFELWYYRLRNGLARVETWICRAENGFSFVPAQDGIDFGPVTSGVIPLTTKFEKRPPVLVANKVQLTKGQSLTVLVSTKDHDKVVSWLESHGLERMDEGTPEC